jgi:divalent metal cation (Fe/Co/Zn/Cd) transporter
MEREQMVLVAKLVAYLLIIAGITILLTAIIYLLTVPAHYWPSYVGVIVGVLMLGIGAALRSMIKKLKLDIK